MDLRSFVPLWLISFSLGLILQGLLGAVGCTPASQAIAPGGSEIVVFVDFSQSIRTKDKGLFEQELATQILPSLAPGDRILIAPITDRTLTEFRPLAEADLPSQPKFNGWLDNLLKYKTQEKEVDRQVAKSKERLQAEVKELFANHSGSPYTDIFSSLLLTQKLFHKAHRRKVLVLMSDMIEDYPPYRFDRLAWNSDTSQRLLTELDGKGLVPDLSGVCVYVAGASAKSPELEESIGSFWQAFFERAKADMHSSRYAHVLLHWPPSKSCGRV